MHGVSNGKELLRPYDKLAYNKHIFEVSWKNLNTKKSKNFDSTPKYNNNNNNNNNN
jgi:hypothetical protein